MKLYGIAIAATPQKDNANILNIVCTPISVTDKKRTEFEVLNDLAFKESVYVSHSHNVIETTKFLSRLVGTLDRVIALQKQSLEENGHEYVPIVLEIGQDSNRPVSSKSSILENLFTGHNFYEETPHVTAEQVPNPMFRSLLNIKSQYAERIDQIREERKNGKPVYETSPIPEDFKPEYERLCAKLASLSSKFLLHWGDFTRHGQPTYSVAPTEFDTQLNNLKNRLDAGDTDVLIELRSIAREVGNQEGRRVNADPHIFILSAPPGYATDKAMQEKFPSYGSCFDWDPTIRGAFYEGFAEARDKNSHYVHMKLPTDPPMPPFTDPVADRICDLFSVIEGTRRLQDIRDKPQWRERIAGIATDASVPASDNTQQYLLGRGGKRSNPEPRVSGWSDNT